MAGPSRRSDEPAAGHPVGMDAELIASGNHGLVLENLQLEQVLSTRTARRERRRAADREQARPPRQRHDRLERDLQRRPDRPRNRRVEVDVLDRRRLVAQARLEEVVDVRHLGVEQVEALERAAGFGPRTCSRPRRSRSTSTSTCTLLSSMSERGPKWRRRKAAEGARRYAGGRVDRDAGRDDAVECAGHEVFAARHVDEPRARERQVEVDRHPAVRVDVVGDLDTHAVGSPDLPRCCPSRRRRSAPSRSRGTRPSPSSAARDSATVRTPNFARPWRARTPARLSPGSPVSGSTCSMMPSAEFEWKPMPQLA